MSFKETHIEEQVNTNETVVPVRSQKKPDSAPHVVPTSSKILKNLQPVRKDTTLACRYELKYRIRETKARAIAHYIQSYIGPDQYSRKCPDFQYPISSLYLDSDHLDLCRETIEQKTNRFKLRIRCYDDKPDTPCFLEIKRRLNNVIMKGRARMSKDLVKPVLEGGSVPELPYKKDQDVLRQFQFYVRALQARPMVLIRYMRQAFEDDSQNRVRVTFDRQLCFKTAYHPHVTTNGPGWHLIPMDFVILEIKFTNYYPAWLSELTKVFDLKQTAMSKYVSSIEQSCSLGYCSPLCQIGM